MALNGKSPILEPADYDDSNGVATIYFILAVLVWCLGTVLTVFTVLAYVGVGSFNQMFAGLYSGPFTLALCIGVGLGTFFLGLLLLTVSSVLKLLQKNATTIYEIRNFDQLVPKIVMPDPASLPPEAGSLEGSDDRSFRMEDPTGTLRTDGNGFQLTVNINAPGGVTTSSTSAGGPAPAPAPSAPAKHTPHASIDLSKPQGSDPAPSKIASKKKSLLLLDEDETEENA